MKIGAVIQARTGSTRLPKKVLLELPYGSGITVLQQVIRKVKKCKKLDEIIVATTTKKADDPIVRIAKKEHVNYFRGSEKDVLKRHYDTAKKFKLDTIVRITSDCPCIDPAILNRLINLHLKTDSDYTNNCIIKSFPRGMDAEVYKISALEFAHFNATKPHEKDGVSEYIYKNHPKDFKIKTLKADSLNFAPDIRVTLDTKKDYALLCYIFEHFKHNQYFSNTQIISLFDKRPWLLFINGESK